MKQKLKIAIDGPAGAGKSTVAKLVADQLSYIYIDTGAMYRALTYKALLTRVDVHNEEELAHLLKNSMIELKVQNSRQAVILDGKDVTDEIRTADVTNNVSFVAKCQTVREEMVKRQQLLARGGGVVMDGRDIGTHVMPDAEVKVFLVASVEERARRRFEENKLKGFEADFEQLKEEIALRDKRDSEREYAPLKKAEGAIELDTTSMTIQDVVNAILHLVNERAE
ncbi:(d)CMP kinase [Fictibacillus gelatini]|uniref:(d)CMP kinase n=1 Tax=Fictibacillus gelatini TaxID=225985 RepID=UPI00041D0146|nr:(d)CMP kinase [Fictibacillus gelatini]